MWHITHGKWYEHEQEKRARVWSFVDRTTKERQGISGRTRMPHVRLIQRPRERGLSSARLQTDLWQAEDSWKEEMPEDTDGRSYWRSNVLPSGRGDFLDDLDTNSDVGEDEGDSAEEKVSAEASSTGKPNKEQAQKTARPKQARKYAWRSNRDFPRTKRLSVVVSFAIHTTSTACQYLEVPLYRLRDRPLPPTRVSAPTGPNIARQEYDYAPRVIPSFQWSDRLGERADLG